MKIDSLFIKKQRNIIRRFSLSTEQVQTLFKMTANSVFPQIFDLTSSQSVSRVCAQKQRIQRKQKKIRENYRKSTKFHSFLLGIKTFLFRRQNR